MGTKLAWICTDGCIGLVVIFWLIIFGLSLFFSRYAYLITVYFIKKWGHELDKKTKIITFVLLLSFIFVILYSVVAYIESIENKSRYPARHHLVANV